jgi:hypothetical protein
VTAITVWTILFLLNTHDDTQAASQTFGHPSLELIDFPIFSFYEHGPSYSVELPINCCCRR